MHTIWTAWVQALPLPLKSCLASNVSPWGLQKPLGSSRAVAEGLTEHGGQAEAGRPGRPVPTQSYDGEEKHPEQTQQRRKDGLVDGGHVDLLVEFGRCVRVVHVIAVCDVLHAQVQQPWGPEDGRTLRGCSPLGPVLSQGARRTEKSDSGAVRPEQQGPRTGCGSPMVPTFGTSTFPRSPWNLLCQFGEEVRSPHSCTHSANTLCKQPCHLIACPDTSLPPTGHPRFPPAPGGGLTPRALLPPPGLRMQSPGCALGITHQKEQ